MTTPGWPHSAGRSSPPAHRARRLGELPIDMAAPDERMTAQTGRGPFTVLARPAAAVAALAAAGIAGIVLLGRRRR